MKVVIVGATDVGVMTARALIERDHAVVLVEADRERIDELSGELDCGFLHGDGTKPSILKEADPGSAGLFFALTEQDTVNVIASLVARSVGYERVVTRIQNPELEDICRELGLDQVIVPVRTISRYLSDMVEGVSVLELSSVLKGEARFFSFSARAEDAGPMGELELSDQVRPVCFYRGEAFHFADADTRLEEGDEVVLLTVEEQLPALTERWPPRTEGE
jgi:trk system potassium uptake protein TrkA